MAQDIPVVDIFAGPGGLGEGFSSFGDGRFRVVLSAEVDRAAHRTLQLRKFYRAIDDRDRQKHYFPEVRKGNSEFQYGHMREALRNLWGEVGSEAIAIRLGSLEGDAALDAAIAEKNLDGKPWVLIGGPPCQAYSLAGRVRNKGNKDYDAAKDHRHFLYESYLRVLQEHGPTVFVMENVKGLLSARVNGNRMIELILRDLRAVEHQGNSYELFALEAESKPQSDGKSFLIRAEDHGLPQARHRVIILGVRRDALAQSARPGKLVSSTAPSLKLLLGDLPRLRSNISRQQNGKVTSIWKAAYLKQLGIVAGATSDQKIIDVIASTAEIVSEEDLGWDGYQASAPLSDQRGVDEYELLRWLRDAPEGHVTNHQSRSHMKSDLGRYAFSSAFALVYGRSPNSGEFPEALAPDHENWSSGKFADRFRTQVASGPASTITSHIAKDGHYYIHWDTSQGRSLTVREAARIQTFPDSYHFLGNRTEQYTQVGNAVPPFLARQIADVVAGLIDG